MRPPLVFLYADESCLGNQFREQARPGGAAGLLEHFHPEHGRVRRDYWTSEPDTTNNRMALISARDLLGALRVPSRVVFTSDSRYLVDGMKDWIHGWARRGWTRKGGEIENLPLWKEAIEATRRHEVQWRWVKGHAGHAQNEYANFLAIRAAREQSGSDGLVASGFDAWMEEEQRKGRMQSYLPPVPDAHAFEPSRRPPTG